MKQSVLAISLSFSLVGCSAAGDGLERGPSGGAVEAPPSPADELAGPGDLPADPMAAPGGFDIVSTDEEGPACYAETRRAEGVPLDLFIMMDHSFSMTTFIPGGVTRWQALAGALQSFVSMPESAGLGVGMSFFGRFAILPPNPADCDVGFYATPVVPIAELPFNATALSQSVMRDPALVDTPTQPALEGALLHAGQWATANPSHRVAVVLATDGLPEDNCGSTVEGVASVAEGGVVAAGIPTFVIGVGPLLDNLNLVATAGGTGRAYLVEDANASSDFLAALNDIRIAAALPCEYTIPSEVDGQRVDYGHVNVSLTPGGGAQAVVPQVASSVDCAAAGGGWFYDDAAAPGRILLCPTTCESTSADLEAQVDVLLGCETVVATVR